MQSTLPISLKKHLAAFAVLLVLAFATYHNAVRSSFIMDDDDIFGNPLIKNSENLKYFFLPDKNRYLGLNGGTTETFYRPLSLVLLMVLYLFFGDNPGYFSIFNILFFVLACFVLYLFALQLTRNYRLALITAALFIVHPIHALLVNYLTASVFTAMLITMTLSVMCFMKADEKKGSQSGWYVLSAVFFVMSCLFHETAIGLPAFIFCILYFQNKNSFRDAVIKLLPFVGILVVYFFLRMKFASLKTSILDNYHLFGMNPLQYLASVVKIFGWYMLKLVHPTGIVLIWKTPVVREYAILWILAMIGLIAGAFHVLRKPGRGFPAMSAAWIFLGFAPVTLACLFQPGVGIMMEPHWVIFSSIGFFMLTAYCIDRFYKSPWVKVVAIFLILFWVKITHVYNFLWADEARYCKFWAETVGPGFQSIDFYLANAYLKEGKNELARENFIKSLTNSFTDYQAYNNLGLIDLNQKRYPEAIAYFRKALDNNPTSSVIYNNLGVAYRATGNFDKAEVEFGQALKINPYYVEPRLNLADMAVASGDHRKAEGLFKENLKVAPYDPRSVYRLISFYLNKTNDQASADELARDFIGHSRDADVLTGLGSLLAKFGLLSTALEAFDKALHIAPNSKDAYVELGKVMGNFDKFDEAIALWREALRLDPHDQNIAALIERAQALKKENKQ